MLSLRILIAKKFFACDIGKPYEETLKPYYKKVGLCTQWNYNTNSNVFASLITSSKIGFIFEGLRSTS